MGTTTDDRTIWRVYADILDLLASAVAVCVVLTLLGVLAGGAMFDGEPFALAVGALLGGLGWPLMFGLRAAQIRRQLAD